MIYNKSLKNCQFKLPIVKSDILNLLIKEPIFGVPIVVDMVIYLQNVLLLLIIKINLRCNYCKDKGHDITIC